MTQFRAAYLFCRALSLSFGVRAAFDVLSLALFFVGYWLGTPTWTGPDFVSFLLKAAAALLLGLFASGLSAAMLGSGALEGEAIQNQRVLGREDRALMWALAGLVLIIAGATQFVGALVTYGTMAAYGPTSFRGNFIPIALVLVIPTLQVGLGLWLAFRASWVRLMRSKASGRDESAN